MTEDKLDFPDEADWLSLPAPDISPSFVEDTLRRVQADVEGRDPDAFVLPRELLDAYEVPEPSPGFVESALRRVRTPSPAWQNVLAGHTVPEPSPDFVERVLRSLQQSADEQGKVHAFRRRSSGAPLAVWLASAAALLLMALVPWISAGSGDAGMPFEVLSSRAFSADTFATALSSLHDRGLAIDVQDPAIRLAELAGLGGQR